MTPSCPNSLTLYLKEIEKIPLLTRNEEKELTKQFSECCQKELKIDNTKELCPKCSHIKEKLISANLRFVVSIAKKYQGFSLSLSDLINEGNIGLSIAVDKFDHSMGYHFISYAVWWIKQSIMKSISEKSRMIRMPINRTNELFKIAKYMDEYYKTNQKPPTKQQISDALNIPVLDIKHILDMAYGHTAIESLVNEVGEPLEILSNPNHTPETSLLNSSMTESIQKLLNGLSSREQIIIIKRYGLDGNDKLSLSKIGELLGLTKERIRQLEKQALKSLQSRAHTSQLDVYFSE